MPLNNFTFSRTNYTEQYQGQGLKENATKYLLFPIKKEFADSFISTISVDDENNYNKKTEVLRQSNKLIKTLLDPFIQLNRTIFFLANNCINYTSQINKFKN